MTTGHASNELLAAYADGSISDGMALLVASHLTYCAVCRGKVARLEAIGGALLAQEPPVAPSPACLARVLARLDCTANAPDVERVARGYTGLPEPVRRLVGADAEAIRWRFRLPGLSDHRLDGFDGEEVSLMRGTPGVRILTHTHSGDEATLVLSGQLRDGERVYRRGDVSLADHHHNHRPEIVGDEPCICLIVLTGRMRFTGLIGRALNLLG